MFFWNKAKKKQESGSRPWYAEGLRFECQNCGSCCGGGPGYVWVPEEDRQRIAAFLGISEEQLVHRYCRRALGKISLVEKASYDCIFLEPEGCRVYPVRPVQCRTFPFWERYLEDRDAWEAVGSRCPGVGKGDLYTYQEILRILRGEDTT